MCNQCSENKGADQLYSNCTADLHLCFCIGQNLAGFLMTQLCILLLIFIVFSKVTFSTIRNLKTVKQDNAGHVEASCKLNKHYFHKQESGRK